MKNLFFAVVMTCGAVAFADEENYQVLYWQVTADSLQEGGDFSAASYAKLYATLANGNVLTETRAIDLAYDPEASETWWATGAGYTEDWVTSLAGCSFYVELLNESMGVMAQSASKTYEWLLANNHVDSQGFGSTVPTSADSAYIFGGYVIPEPTSAMLMLLGVAGLALKRKRRG